MTSTVTGLNNSNPDNNNNDTGCNNGDSNTNDKSSNNSMMKSDYNNNPIIENNNNNNSNNNNNNSNQTSASVNLSMRDSLSPLPLPPPKPNPKEDEKEQPRQTEETVQHNSNTTNPPHTLLNMLQVGQTAADATEHVTGANHISEMTWSGHVTVLKNSAGNICSDGAIGISETSGLVPDAGCIVGRTDVLSGLKSRRKSSASTRHWGVDSNGYIVMDNSSKYRKRKERRLRRSSSASSTSVTSSIVRVKPQHLGSPKCTRAKKLVGLDEETIELQALMAHQAKQDAGAAAVLGRYTIVRDAEVADEMRRKTVHIRRLKAAGLPLRATKHHRRSTREGGRKRNPNRVVITGNRAIDALTMQKLALNHIANMLPRQSTLPKRGNNNSNNTSLTLSTQKSDHCFTPIEATTPRELSDEEGFGGIAANYIPQTTGSGYIDFNGSIGVNYIPKTLGLVTSDILSADGAKGEKLTVLRNENNDSSNGDVSNADVSIDDASIDDESNTEFKRTSSSESRSGGNISNLVDIDMRVATCAGQQEQQQSQILQQGQENQQVQQQRQQHDAMMSEWTISEDVLRTVEAAALLVDSELLICADQATALHPININTLNNNYYNNYNNNNKANNNHMSRHSSLPSPTGSIASAASIGSAFESFINKRRGSTIGSFSSMDSNPDSISMVVAHRSSWARVRVDPPPNQTLEGYENYNSLNATPNPAKSFAATSRTRSQVMERMWMVLSGNVVYFFESDASQLPDLIVLMDHAQAYTQSGGTLDVKFNVNSIGGKQMFKTSSSSSFKSLAWREDKEEQDQCCVGGEVVDNNDNVNNGNVNANNDNVNDKNDNFNDKDDNDKDNNSGNVKKSNTIDDNKNDKIIENNDNVIDNIEHRNNDNNSDNVNDYINICKSNNNDNISNNHNNDNTDSSIGNCDNNNDNNDNNTKKHEYAVDDNGDDDDDVDDGNSSNNNNNNKRLWIQTRHGRLIHIELEEEGIYESSDATEWVQWLQDSRVAQMRAGLVRAQKSHRDAKELLHVMANQHANELIARENKEKKLEKEREEKIEQSLMLLRQLEQEREEEYCRVGKCTVS